MRVNFKRSVDFVIRQEVRPGHEQDGDLHLAANDPGGTTCFGFAQRYQKFDVASLVNNRPLAEQKYLELYWIPAGCDQLIWPLDIIQLDTAINMGVGGANLLLKQSGNNSELYLWSRLNTYWSKHSVNLSDWVKRLINLHFEIIKPL